MSSTPLTCCSIGNATVSITVFALAQLPQSVQNQGVTVQKKSTAILLFVTLTSPNATHDSLFLSNYATINIRDELSRLPGVGNVTVST